MAQVGNHMFENAEEEDIFRLTRFKGRSLSWGIFGGDLVRVPF